MPLEDRYNKTASVASLAWGDGDAGERVATETTSLAEYKFSLFQRSAWTQDQVRTRYGLEADVEVFHAVGSDAKGLHDRDEIVVGRRLVVSASEKYRILGVESMIGGYAGQIDHLALVLTREKV